MVGRARSTEVSEDEVEELPLHGLFCVASLSGRVGGTVGEMVAHELATDSHERLAHGGDLHENIGAISALLHHPLNPAYLTLDPPEPGEIGCPNLRVDLGGVGWGIGGAGVVGHGKGFGGGGTGGLTSGTDWHTLPPGGRFGTKELHG